MCCLGVNIRPAQRRNNIIQNSALALSRLVGKYICKGLSTKFVVKVKLLTLNSPLYTMDAC